VNLANTLFADQNSLTHYSATGLPTGLTINSTTGVISGTIPVGADSHSPYHVTITVTDKGFRNHATFTWTVTPAVTFTSVSDQISNEGKVLPASGNGVLTVVANDGPGKPLTYTMTGNPPGLSIDPHSGVISGTIAQGSFAQSPYTVTVTATDGTNTNHITFKWTVNPVVTISSLGAQSSLQAANLTNLPVVSAQDANSTTLSYTATGLPAGLTIDSATGQVSGTITAAPGSYTVKVTATDTGGFSNSVTFTWKVNAVVTITKIPNQKNAEGASLSLQVSAQDANHTALTYSATGLPAGLTIDPTKGLISGKISAGDSAHSPYTVTVTANDSTFQASQTFTWTVT
jgi:hypothetical protein